MGSSVGKKRLLIASGVLLVLLLGTISVFAYVTWAGVNRVSIDRPPPATAPPGGEEQPGEPEPPETEGVIINLLVGSDSRDQLDDLEGFGAFEGQRADVVMVLIRAPGGAALLSLPRDLLVPDPCRGGETRINALLAGCPDGVNGPTLLTVGVERLIGERVDHYAMVDMAGFLELVDALGGYEICVERPVRDTRSGLDLPAGCTLADGAQTLAWLRSRRTEELTDSGWRTVPGVNDLARNERQRSFIIDAMRRLADFSSPQALAATARTIAPFVTVDETLSLTDAVGLAWAIRRVGAGVTELTVSVRDHVTPDGSSVLVATEPVDEIVALFLASHAEVEGERPDAG